MTRDIMSGSTGDWEMPEHVGPRREYLSRKKWSNIKEIGPERPIYVLEVAQRMTTIVDLFRASGLPQFGKLAPSVLPKKEKVFVERRPLLGEIAATLVYVQYDTSLELDALAKFEDGRPVLQRLGISWNSGEDQSSVVELNEAWIADLLSASDSQVKQLAQRVCSEVLVLRPLSPGSVRGNVPVDSETANG